MRYRDHFVGTRTTVSYSVLL